MKAEPVNCCPRPMTTRVSLFKVVGCLVSVAELKKVTVPLPSLLHYYKSVLNSDYCSPVLLLQPVAFLLRALSQRMAVKKRVQFGELAVRGKGAQGPEPLEPGASPIASGVLPKELTRVRHSRRPALVGNRPERERIVERALACLIKAVG